MNEQNLRRYAAVVIDFFLISIVYSVLVNVLPTLVSHREVGIQWSFTLVPDGFVLLSLGYFIGCDFLNRGESLGKDIIGLQTRGLDGSVLDMRGRVCRTLLKWVSLMVWPLAFLLYFWRKKDFTLQDYIAKTKVIRARKFKPTL